MQKCLPPKQKSIESCAVKEVKTFEEARSINEST